MSTFDDRERCATCRAFSVKEQECRRHAPTPMMVPTQSALGKPGMATLGVWPAAREGDWCAEWVTRGDS